MNYIRLITAINRPAQNQTLHLSPVPLTSTHVHLPNPRYVQRHPSILLQEGENKSTRFTRLHFSTPTSHCSVHIQSSPHPISLQISTSLHALCPGIELEHPPLTLSWRALQTPFCLCRAGRPCAPRGGMSVAEEPL